MLARPDDLHCLLAAEVKHGEHLIWSSQADPLMTVLSKWVIVPFAVLWLMVSIAGVLRSLNEAGAMQAAFVSVFVVIGIYMLFSPIIEYIGTRGTIFGITDSRLIVVRRNGRSIKSVLLSGVRQVECIRKRHGVTLRIPTSLVSDGDGGQKVDYLDLHGLKDGERAYRLLTGNAQPARQGGPRAQPDRGAN